MVLNCKDSMPASAFSTPLKPAIQTSLGPGRLRLRNGKFLLYDNSPARSEAQWKLSEMINPDGSVTVRRKVVNPDGNRSIVQEEYASMDQRILGKYDHLRYEESSDEDPTSSSLRSRSSASSYSTPTVSRNISFESYDHSSEGSTFSVHWNKPLTNEDMETSRVRERTKHAIESPKIALRSHADDSPWNFNDADLSAISGDSIGYPMFGPKGKMQRNHHEEQNDDASSEWSLLYGDTNDQDKSSLTGKGAPSKPLGKPPLPQKGNMRSNTSRENVPKIPTKQTFQTSRGNGMKEKLGNLASHDVPSGGEEDAKAHQDLPVQVLKQADTLAKPQVKYFSDPGIETPSTPLGPGALRTTGALLDAPSLHSNKYDSSTEVSSTASTDEITYTVRKNAPDDQLGIFVGVRDVGAGPQLVISRVKPGGKFAESPIERGDIVVSINGVNFLQYPNAQEALEIVRDAKDKVTFVVTKNKDALDASSVDEFVLPNLPHENVHHVVNDDESYVKTREIANRDGSHTTIDEFFYIDGRKYKQTTRRTCQEFDGSARDISFSSLDADGRMVIFVKKTIQSEVVGLRLENQRTYRGQNTIVVSQVFPSGLFARTPLSVGDIIVSVNDIDYRVDSDIVIAAETMSRSKSGIKVIAMKPSDWIERRHQRISQPRQLVETFTIEPPKSKAYQFDDSAYDDSVFGYNSTKKVSLKDFSASERLGLIIVSQYTRLGVLLIAKEVAPSSRLAGLGLKNGDIILSINGIDMRREPDASRAMSLFRNSKKDIEIEYQRLTNLTEAEMNHIPVARMESFLPDGTKSIRTETKNPDGSVVVRIEEVTPANPIDAALSSLGPVNGSCSGDLPNGLPRNRSHFKAVATGSSSERSTLEPVTITVNKSKRSQYVGIDLVVVKDTLCVSGVGKNGLLLGKPLLPGDTVLEINGHDFRRNPSARRAQSILSNATKSIRFTILKTSMLKGLHGDQRMLPSRSLALNCFKCKKRSDNDEMDDLASKKASSS